MAFDRSNPGEGHYKAKLTLRWLTLISTIIAIGTGGYAWIFCLWLFIPLGLSFIWNIANIARRLSAPTPIHPGANVALDLILWLMFFIALIIAWIASAAGLVVTSANFFNNSNLNNYYSDTNGVVVQYTTDTTISGCLIQDQTTGNCALTQSQLNAAHNYAAIAVAACVFGTLSFLFHFVLFIVACVDTHRKRHGVYERNYKAAEFGNAGYAAGGMQQGPGPVFQGQQPIYQNQPQPIYQGQRMQ